MKPWFFLFLLFLLLACENNTVKIEFYEKGLIYNTKTNKYTPKIYEEGTYELQPNEEMVLFDFSTNEYFTDTLLSMTRDIKPIKFQVSYSYEIWDTSLYKLAVELGPNYHEEFVAPFVEKKCANAAGIFPLSAYKGDYPEKILDEYNVWISRHKKFRRYFKLVGTRFTYISVNSNPGAPPQL